MTPRKHQALAARIRSDLDLIERSPVWSDVSSVIRSHVETELNDHFDGLGYSNIIYPQALTKIGLSPEQTIDERKEVLRFEKRAFEPSLEEQRLVSMLADGAQTSMSDEWIWRAGEHCEYMRELGWFPFFVTLTVDPKMFDPEMVFGIGATALRDYFKSLARVSMKACGLTRKEMHKASDRDYLQHFLSVEHGKSGHHHHAHGLLWFKNIPEDWKVDPNQGLSPERAVRRRCMPLETYWPYCIPSQRPANYYRHLGDVWSELGHKVPIVDGKGLTLMPAIAGGAYCAKYMGKEDKQWKHRIKASRNLGLKRIARAISRAPSKLLEQQTAILPTFDHLTIQTTSISVPLRLIKRLAKLELYCREFMSMDLSTLLSSRPKPFAAMLESLKETQPWLLSSKERYDWLLSVLPPGPREFCEDTWFQSLEYFQDAGFSKEQRPAAVNGIGAYQ